MDALSTLLQQMQYLTDTRFFSLNAQGKWAYSISKKKIGYIFIWCSLIAFVFRSKRYHEKRMLAILL